MAIDDVKHVTGLDASIIVRISSGRVIRGHSSAQSNTRMTGDKFVIHGQHMIVNGLYIEDMMLVDSCVRRDKERRVKGR